MISFILLVFLGVLGQAIHGWGFHASCDSIEQPLRNGMAVAFLRAREAKEQIWKTPRDRHVEALVQLLFGGDNAKITDAAKRLEDVDWVRIFNSRPDIDNVIIYCSTDRITNWDVNGVTIGYRDLDRDSQVKGASKMDDCRNLCPWYLNQIAGPPPKYDTPDELVKKAGDVKALGLVGKLSAKLADDDYATPIDSLAGFEHVLLHELTHTKAAGYSDDTPKNKSYGWKKSVKCQESKNADTLAFFALAVELVLHRGYTVNKDGTLQKLTQS